MRLPTNMKILIDDDPAFLAALRAGIMDAIRSPDFLHALALEVGPTVVWLTTQQTRAITQLAPSTFARWCKRHRGQIVISYALGKKEPRYRYDSVQALMNAAAVGGETSKLLVLPNPEQRGGRERKAS